MIIVVTGGIGSGKSSVCRILAERYGFHVYEADMKVKELYDVHPSLLDDIEVALGHRVRDDRGRLMPSELSRLIFNDRSALDRVESLVFPALKDDFRRWMAEYDDGLPFIFESATILEKPQFEGFGDITLLVDAPYQTRLERAASRDGDKAKVEARMAYQKLMNDLSEGASDDRIDYVIDNSGKEDELMTEIEEFITEIGYNTNVTQL